MKSLELFSARFKFELKLDGPGVYTSVADGCFNSRWPKFFDDMASDFCVFQAYSPRGFLDDGGPRVDKIRPLELSYSLLPKLLSSSSARLSKSYMTFFFLFSSVLDGDMKSNSSFCFRELEMSGEPIRTFFVGLISWRNL